MALLLGAVPAWGCGQGSQDHRLFREGRRVFVSAGCGGCHTVASAHTYGQQGPNFDTSEKLDRRQIRMRLEIGVGGMPSFRHRLSERQKRAVTEFVYETMHRRR